MTDKLNALGKPLSEAFDPEYKIQTPLTSIKRLAVTRTRTPLEQWELYQRLMAEKRKAKGE